MGGISNCYNDIEGHTGWYSSRENEELPLEIGLNSYIIREKESEQDHSF